MIKRILTEAVLLSVFVSCSHVHINAQELNDESVTKKGQAADIPMAVGDEDLYPLAEGKCGESVYYELDQDGNLRIYGTGDMANYTYEDYGSSGFPSNVPGWYDNHHNDIKNVVIEAGVTSIGKAAFISCQNLESITIPESVTRIGAGAFISCYELKEINLPESLQSIGTFAFENCSLLSEMHIPASVTEIGEQAFSYCYSLEKITVASENTSFSSKAGILFNKAQSELIYCPYGISGDYTVPSSVTSIGNYAFSDCKNLTAIDLPEGLVRIGKFAFYNCSSATRIDIPSSVREIGESAFYGCKKITSAYIPEGITEIADFAFSQCNALTDVRLPATLKRIGNYSFSQCYMLNEIDLPDGLTEIGDNAFFNCGFRSIVIPSTVARIGDRCFGSSYALSDIVLSEGLESIGAGAFANCNQLTSLYIPDHVRSIGDSAFTNCKGLTEIHLPADLESLGAGAFYYCTGLTEIIVPAGVKAIANNTFNSCTALSEITLPEALESIGDYAFSECDSLSELMIPDGVTSIGEYAFMLCYNLQEIKLPANLTSLGKYAFHMCSSLPRISLPDGLTEINEYTFNECTSLAEVKFSRSLTSIGYYAFSNCSSLKSITLPAGLETIIMDAFRDCSGLESIVLPVSTVRIGPRAFSGCKSLTDVYYTGSETQYYEMLLDDRWDTTWNDYFYHADWHFDYVVIEVTGISVSPKTAVLKHGETLQLKATLEPAEAEEAITWISSDATVATVNTNGLVTAKAVGTATITAAAGSYIATCQITVESNYTIEDLKLNLESPVGVKCKIYVPDEEVSKISGLVWFDGKWSDPVLLSKLKKSTVNGKVTRVFTTDVATPQLRDTIKVKLQDEAGAALPLTYNGVTTTEGQEYNAYTHIEEVLKNDNASAEQKRLAKTLDDLGKYSQYLFDYNTDNIEGDLDPVEEIPAGALDQYAMVQTGTADGIEYSEIKLEFASDTVLRVYFELTGDNSYKDYTFTVDGVTVTPQKSGSRYVIKKSQIASALLDEEHVFKVCKKGSEDGIEIKCSALSYVQKRLSDETNQPDTDLRNVLISLYWYNDAANTVFGQ